MKDKIKKFLSNGRVVFVVFIILEAILTFMISPTYGDDVEFATYLDGGKTLTEVISQRYDMWSSRTIIETILISITIRPKVIWQVIQIFMMWLLAYSISELFVEDEHKKEGNIVICSLILTYPFSLFSAAGWEATTINYIWPLAAGMYSFLAIKKIFAGEKISIIENILFVISIIFACNMEQLCVIIFAVYLLFTIIYIFKHKKIHPLLVIQLIISIASLIFIFTCPGNQNRQEVEIDKYLNYTTLSIFDKLGLGFTSTFDDMLTWTIFPIAMLCIVLPCYIFSTYKEKIYRATSIFPALVLFPLRFFNTTFVELFPYLGKIKGSLMNNATIINAENPSDVTLWVTLIISILFFIALVVSTILIYNNLKDNKALLVLLLGIMSKFMMIFTSTIFSSAPRTMMYFDFSIYIVIGLILQEMLKRKNEIYNKLVAGVQTLAAYQIINNIFYIWVLNK